MDQLKLLLEHQLTDREIIIYQLISSKAISIRRLAKALTMDHTTLLRAYARTSKKIEGLQRAGFLTEK